MEQGGTTRRRRGAEPEPIADLFGDVVQDAPPLLYGTDAGAAPEARGILGPPVAPAPPAAADPPPTAPVPEAAPPRRRPRGASVQPADRTPRAADVVWRDDNGLLSGVVILHGLLTVLTLGFYRFWMATEQRKLVWSHTELEGEPLEWTGEGSELFIGAMIAILFLGFTLGAANLAVAWIGLSSGGDPQTMAVVQAVVIGGVAMLPLWQYAAFRARRYRLSRTRWRSLRFGMEGSGLSLVALWALWAPVVIATAGLAFPLWRWARERHMTARTFWGRERFGFDGAPWPLLAHWAPLWGLAAGAAALAASPRLREAAGLASPEALLSRGPAALLALAAAGALLVWLLWLNYRAAETRLFWNARRLGGARAWCEFSVWHLVDAYLAMAWRNIWPGIGVYIAIFVITLIPTFAAVRAEFDHPGAGGIIDGLDESFFNGLRTWRGQGLMLMALALNYVLSAVFVLWLWQAVHARRVQAHLCESLHVTGLETLDDAEQRGRDDATEAEGFADALDVAGL